MEIDSDSVRESPSLHLHIMKRFIVRILYMNGMG